MNKNIILTGSLAYDYVFDIPDPFSKYILADKIHKINISIITDTHKKSFGGTAGNQAFYLSKLGVRPYIFATAGHDFADYKKFLRKNKINIQFIKISKRHPTAAGFVMTDIKDNQIWMYAIGAMKDAGKLKLKTILNYIDQPLIMISPNDQQAIINLVDECITNNLDFAFDPAFYIPHLPTQTLAAGVKKAKIIFGNDYEIDFIEKRLGKKITKLIKADQIIVKTLSDKGSAIFSKGKWMTVGIYKTKTVDPTGAGDAYRAGFLYGYLNDYPVKICGWMGAVIASYAVEVKGTMNLKFTKKGYDERINY